MLNTYDWLKTAVIRRRINRPDAAVYVISYPKCGRTWLRLLIGKAICDQYGLPEEQMIDTYRITAVPDVLRTHFSHDFSSLKAGFPYNRLPADKSAYADSKVIFITRNVKDVLVSSYFQATKRIGKFQGNISEFIRSKRYGARKIVTFYNLWHTNQNVPEAFMHLRYEEMHADPEAALKQVLQFMELQNFDDALVRAAVEFSRFENMKKLEAKGFFRDEKMQPGQKSDTESFKVRKGKVGGYREYLSAADIAYVDGIIAETGCPFAEGGIGA